MRDEATTRTFGATVSAVRAAAGLSLRELARRAGLSPSFLFDVEHDNRVPSEEGVERLAVVLGMDPAFLLATAGRVTAAVAAMLRADPELGVALAHRAVEAEDMAGCSGAAFMPHLYLSTSCRHAIEDPALHDRCRRTCKWCKTECRCACHTKPQASEGDQQ